MTTTHTPGPIYPSMRCNNCMRYFHGEEELKLVLSGGEWYNACPDCLTDQFLMNMPELAAAPDLLAVVSRLRALLPAMDDPNADQPGSEAVDALCEIWDDLRAAEAKARGQD